MRMNAECSSLFFFIFIIVAGRYNGKPHLPLLCLKANYNMALARKAPKIILMAPRKFLGSTQFIQNK